MSDYNMNMKKQPGTVLLNCVVAAAVAVVFNLAVPVAGTVTGAETGKVFAQKDDKKKKPKRSTRRTPAIRAKVYEKLNEAQVAAEEKRYDDAIKTLDALRDKGGKGALNSYELANLYNMYAFIYFTKEQYSKALESYIEVAKQPDIPEAMEVNTKFTIAQLYFVMEEWQKGVDQLKEWFAIKEQLGEPAGANSYALLAQGYYQLKKYDTSMKHMQYAVDNYKEKGKVPKEQWYGLLRYLHYEKNNYDTVIEILEETLMHYQKKQYWLQLAAMYGEKKRETDQLAAYEIAYDQGLLEKEKELINMAYLFLAADIPYKAAKVMDKGIREKKIEATSKNLELLGNSWRAAQEVKKAIPEMAKAASKSDKGDLWARLGNIYLDNEQFDKAAKAVRNGLRKGGVKRPDTANLVLGMAEFNLGNYEAARKAFDKAKKEERSKVYAEQWLKYMEREIKRQKSLQEEIEADEADKAAFAKNNEDAEEMMKKAEESAAEAKSEEAEEAAEEAKEAEEERAEAEEEAAEERAEAAEEAAEVRAEAEEEAAENAAEAA